MGLIHPSYLFDHDDVIKWKPFPRYWPFVRGIHRWPVNSPHKGQWRGALMFSFICAWINDWVNNREAGNLRRHRAHHHVIVMFTIRNTRLVQYASTEVHFQIKCVMSFVSITYICRNMWYGNAYAHMKSWDRHNVKESSESCIKLMSCKFCFSITFILVCLSFWNFAQGRAVRSVFESVAPDIKFPKVSPTEKGAIKKRKRHFAKFQLKVDFEQIVYFVKGAWMQIAVNSRYLAVLLQQYSLLFGVIEKELTRCPSFDLSGTYAVWNILRVTGHLCGEFTGPRWIPHTKGSDAELWCFLDLRLNERLSKQWWGWLFETPSRPLLRHCNG